jgi:ethanolamine permease
MRQGDDTAARTFSEVAEYVATGVGMALACASLAMLGELFSLVSGVRLVAAIVGAGALCTVISLSIAELASMYPSSPGVRTYFRAAYGDRLSLALTFLVLVIVVLFAGVECAVLEVAIRRIMPFVPRGVGITVMLVGVAALNMAGIEVPRRAQLWLTVCIVLAIAAVAVIGLGRAPMDSSVAKASPAISLPALLGATGGAIFLFTGFEWVTPLGRTPASYRARLPWSMPIALAILTALFALLALALDRVLGATAVASSPIPHLLLGESSLSHAGLLVMVAVSVLCTITTFNAGLMGTSRLIYAVAREKRFPQWGTRISYRSGAPVGAILFVASACWVSAMVQWGADLQDVVAVVCASLYAIVYSAFVLANLRLRATKPQALRPFRSRMPAVIDGAVAVATLGVGLMLLASVEQHRTAAIVLVLASLLSSWSCAELVLRFLAAQGSPAPLAVKTLDDRKTV